MEIRKGKLLRMNEGLCMGKLFFYSDQVVESPGNRRLDDLLFTGLNTESIKVAYIPSTEDKERKYFKIKAQYYRDYGIHNIMFFDIYSEFNPLKIEELLSVDIIHLSAGNPIEFRKMIKKRKMEQVLRDYYNKGGTIVGVSGGAVQLGKSTKLFQMFMGDNDDAELDTLNFVDFEFLPHYNRWDDVYKKEVSKHAESTGTTVYAGNDGDGIIVENNKVQMVGEIVVMNEGRRKA